MCGTMHYMWISTRKGSRRDAGAPYSLRRSTTRREIAPCVDGVLMPPMATGKRKRSYSRIPLVRASLCGPFPPRRLRRHRGSLSSHQSKTLKKISKMRKCLMDRSLRVLFQKIFLKNVSFAALCSTKPSLQASRRRPFVRKPATISAAPAA